jgi:uncharacterized membrane protein YfcA
VDLWTGIAIVSAGFAGGAINGVVGAGTIITFPVLLASGFPPVVANGTNTFGLSFGAASSAYAYRRELATGNGILTWAVLSGIVGAALGAGLVLALPEAVFTTAVPWLIASATALVAVQPLVSRWLRKPTSRSRINRPKGLAVGIGLSGIYGGYFGAGQGVVLMGVLGWLYDRDPQHANAAKNLFAGVANLTAAVVFVIAGRVSWTAALLLAAGAIVGGTIGARGARKLSPPLLRAAVIVIGVAAATLAWIRLG